MLNLTVQIVPLWNWNIDIVVFSPLRAIVQIVPLWNWNPAAPPAADVKAGSNCTFMELKYNHTISSSSELTVQIVPLWNWNNFGNTEPNFDNLFKLYLYGIEIYYGMMILENI